MGDKGQRIFLCFLIVFFIFCALFAAQKIVSYDDWWHLKTGEWIWEHKAIPHVDPFSYTFQGAKWIDYEWLFQTVIFPIYQLGGFVGLIIFKIIIALLIFLILFFTCRELDGGKKWLSIIILFIALQITSRGFLIRPQIFSLLFLALYVYLLALHRGERITTRQLIIFLLPVHILWVNVHGSFLLGIFLVGAYAMGSFVPLALSHHRDLKPVFQDKRFQNFLLLGILLIVASLINPYTYQIFLIPLETAGAQETLRAISEWIPIDPRFLGVLVVDPLMWFRVLFLIGAISFLVWRDNLKRIEDVLVFAVLSYMAFKHVRFCGPFAVVAAPIIVSNLTQVQWRVREWRWLPLVSLIIIIAFAVNDVRTLIRQERLGFGVWTHYPEATVKFLKEHDVKGRIFNTYGYGGYIIWHLWPHIQVFIDGRAITIYDQDFFWSYGLAFQNKETWEKVLERYGIEIVLIQDAREKGYSLFFYWLDEDEDWRLVAFDDVSNLYIKKGAKFNKLIEQYGFHYLRPSDISMEYAKEKKDDKSYLEALENELKVACQRFPQNFYPFYYLGIYHRIYGTKEHLEESLAALRKAITNMPYLPQGYYELGFTLMKLERYDEAKEALKKAMRLSPDILADSYYNLGLCLFQTGDINEAIKFLEKYREKAGFETKVEAYRLLGRAYLQRHKLQKALSCFERVGYLEKPTWDTLLNMGVAYFGLDKFDKARECFERAREENPGALKVVYNLAVDYEKLGLLDKAKNMYQKASQMKPQTPEEETLIKKSREKIERRNSLP
jgi:tetratricopeptide (TPR) repeat protein